MCAVQQTLFDQPTTHGAAGRSSNFLGRTDPEESSEHEEVVSGNPIHQKRHRQRSIANLRVQPQPRVESPVQ